MLRIGCITIVYYFAICLNLILIDGIAALCPQCLAGKAETLKLLHG